MAASAIRPSMDECVGNRPNNKCLLSPLFDHVFFSLSNLIESYYAAPVLSFDSPQVPVRLLPPPLFVHYHPPILGSSRCDSVPSRQSMTCSTDGYGLDLYWPSGCRESQIDTNRSIACLINPHTQKVLGCMRRREQSRTL